MLFYQTRSHAIVLYDTLPAVCIDKVVCMKTKDELFQKVRSTPRVPRVVIQSNSKIGLQDQREQDAITSNDQPSGSTCTWETGSNTMDYRIPGVPLSAVEQQDTHRKDKVKSLSRSSRFLPSRLQADEGDQQHRDRSSSFAKHLQNSNALIATCTGKARIVHCTFG